MSDKNRRILVVDDLPSARKVIVRLLKKMGYEQFVEAADGEQAFAEFQKQSFDLVISDWHMPKIDGLQLLEKLQSVPNGDNAAFLFITSTNERDEVISALKAGVREYLCKPFSSDTLEDKLRSMLEGPQ